MRPLFTRVSMSAELPPLNESPALPVDVAYKYTPPLTVIVISDLPAIYPPIDVTFKEASVVVEVKV
jgi:hypothetical protein